MATTSTISVVHNDGSVSQVYCHWDGYLENNGRKLVNHYNSLELAEELVSLGDLSELKDRCKPVNKDHSYDNPEADVCVYYGRDRGEENVAPRIFDSLDSFCFNRTKEEYNYIFLNGRWYLIIGNDDPVICEISEEMIFKRFLNDESIYSVALIPSKG